MQKGTYNGGVKVLKSTFKRLLILLFFVIFISMDVNTISKKIQLTRQKLAMEKDNIKRTKYQQEIRVLELEKSLEAAKKNMK